MRADPLGLLPCCGSSRAAVFVCGLEPGTPSLMARWLGRLGGGLAGGEKAGGGLQGSNPCPIGPMLAVD